MTKARCKRCGGEAEQVNFGPVLGKGLACTCVPVNMIVITKHDGTEQHIPVTATLGDLLEAVNEPEPRRGLYFNLKLGLHVK